MVDDVKVTPPAGTPPTPGAPSTEAKSLLDGATGEGTGKAGSLIDGVPVVDVKKVEANPNDPNAWVLSEGVMGTGPRPEWFKADKYGNVVEQAKAYPELEKRFGAFTGAPKDGKYEYKAPDGSPVQLNMDHPLTQGFNKWAAEAQLSQEGYNAVIGMLTQYEASQQPDMAEIKAELGTDADARIGAVAKWGKANFDAKTFEQFRSATSGKNAADVFALVEHLIGKTSQKALPKPGQDVPAGVNTRDAIVAEQAKLGPDGKRLMDTDAKHRTKVNKLWNDFYASQA